MDLAKRFDTRKACEEPHFLHLVGPDGELIFLEDEEGKPIKEEPVGLMLIGKDAAEVRRLERRQINESIKRMAKRLGRGPTQLTTAEQAEAQATLVLAACTKGFRNIIVAGEEVPFSMDAATDLYERFPWVREQVDAFIEDRENFLGN